MAYHLTLHEIGLLKHGIEDIRSWTEDSPFLNYQYRQKNLHILEQFTEFENRCHL